MNSVQARRGETPSACASRPSPGRPRLRPRSRGLVLPAPIFRRWGGERVRRWSRAWVAVLVLLIALPLALFLPPVQRLLFPLHHEDHLLAAARAEEVDASLLAALVYHESGFRAHAVSDAGAVGLTQLLPSTARWVSEQCGTPLRSAADLGRPEVNLRLGACYLGWLLRRFEGDAALALAAYNSGQHTVDRWLEEPGPLRVEDLPYPETRHFVAGVLQTRERYRRLYPHLDPGAVRK